MKFSLQKVSRRSLGTRGASSKPKRAAACEARSTALLGALAAGACLLSSACSDDDGFGIIDPDAGYRPPVPTTEASIDAAAPPPDAASTEPSSNGDTSEPPSEVDAGVSSSEGTSSQAASIASGDDSVTAGASSDDTTPTIAATSSDAPTSDVEATSSAQSARSTDATGPSGVVFTLDTTVADAGTDAATSDADDTQLDASVSNATESELDAAIDASSDSSVDAAPPIHVASLQELTDQSASDYADNEHGLIDGTRLQQWHTNWQVQRPAAIDGRLIILQVVPSGVTTEVHVSANEAAGIYSYLVPSSEFNSPRSSGLSSFESDIPSGEAADAWLAKYAIDPRSDFILLTFEDQASTTNSVVQSVGRAWVFLKYWGVATDHIGILNGSVDWNGTNAGVALSLAVDEDYSVPPLDGTVTVRDLGVDATTLSISLEEIIAILHQEPGAPDVDNVRIVDARGGAEALGLKKATSTGRTDCASYTGSSPNAKCSTPFEGRIKGAHSVPWTQFLDSKANGFRFLPRDTIKTTFDEQAAWDVDAEWSIQYCRTNQRSTVTGIVANVILGYPTRFYETSFIEWGHSSTTPGIVAADFPFRTDLPSLTEHAELHPDDLGAYTPGGTLAALTQPVTWVAGPNYNDADDVSPPSVQPWPVNASGWPKLDPTATTTRLAIDTDRAYLRGVSVEDLD